ncbi:helix-turn-helix transcriptional regulator [Novosphingobium sp.]|uniref:helix-turn-helix transcriptional regulator n=1 Tax=Novosphingobium sp. TaxID=1874826 RepID=UPI00286E5AA9|nr:helix-turn-helix transcriptional regulator [Novosphingobium sp.]
MTAQFVDIAGSPMVILSREEFSRLNEAAECYAEIVAAVEAQRRKDDGEEYIPADVVSRLVAGDNPLLVWRNYRRLTLDALGNLVGRKGSFISKLEKGKCEGGIRLWQDLAKALEVDLDDLLPVEP